MLRQEAYMAALIAGAATLLWSTSIAQSQTIADGVFTQAQVESGQVVYEARCKNCHNMREYGDMLEAWQNTPLVDFWYNILGNMPADNPGSLMDSEYTDVIAYILSENGFPTGDVPLDPNDGMDEINIVAP